MTEKITKEVANVIGEVRENPDEINFMLQLTQIFEKYDIQNPEERIDIAIDGVELFFDRQKQEVVSDIRESLEMQYRFMGYE